MALITRRPTGQPAWRLALIAGAEKCGKSYALAQASGNKDIINRTFWISFGEPHPDEYATIEGADFEIVDLARDYGGVNYPALMNALRDAIAEPPAEDGRPNMIVLDGIGRVWGALTGQAQYAARKRLVNKGRPRNQQVEPPEKGHIADGEATVHPDLWNAANDRWDDLIDLLRSHNGPVWVTALLKQTTIMDAAGRPTKEKQWKVEAQKRLEADCGVVVEVPAYREFYLTGVVSTRFEPVGTGNHTPETRFNDFTVRALWEKLGLTANAQRGDTAVMSRPPSPQFEEGPSEVEMFHAIDQARRQEDPSARKEALRDVWRHYGGEFLSTMILTTKRGPMTAAEVINGLVAEANGEIERANVQQQPQAERAPGAQENAHLPVQPQPAPVQEPVQPQPAPVQEPVQPQPAPVQENSDPPAKKRADAAQRRADEQAKAARNQLHAFVTDEAIQQAHTLGLSPEAYMGDIQPNDTDRISVHVAANRGKVIAALRGKGMIDAAECYEAAAKGGTFATWYSLTGGHLQPA